MKAWLSLVSLGLAGALSAAPSDDYNQGVEAYRRGEFPAAEKSFENAARDEALKDRALFNLGNARARQGRLEEAVKAYQDALHVNPQEQRIRENLEWAEKLKQQQPPPQQQQGKDDKNSSDPQKQNQGGGSSDKSEPNPDQSQDGKAADKDQQQKQDSQKDPQASSNNEQTSSSRNEGRDAEQQPRQGQAGEKQGPLTREEAERMIDSVPDRPGVTSDRQKEGKRGRSKMDW